MKGRVGKCILALLLVVPILLSSACSKHKQTALEKIEKSKAFSYKNIERVLELNDFTSIDDYEDLNSDQNQHLLREGVYFYQGDVLCLNIVCPDYTVSGGYLPNKFSLGSEYENKVSKTRKELEKHQDDVNSAIEAIDDEMGVTRENKTPTSETSVLTSEELFSDFVYNIALQVGAKNGDTVDIFGEGETMCGFTICEAGRVACYKNGDDIFYISVKGDIDKAITIFEKLIDDLGLPQPYIGTSEIVKKAYEIKAFAFDGNPINVNKEFEVVSADENGSYVGGNVISAWSEGGHTKVYFNENYPLIEVKQKEQNVENILVLGISSRGTDHVNCFADSIMILTIDERQNSTKLTSLMSCAGVEIEGRSSIDMLRNAYAYGGIGLLINTINRDFGLDMQRFIMFDFNSAASVIDLLGGVKVNVQLPDIEEINTNINEINQLTGRESKLLTSEGEQLLDGNQVVAWMRMGCQDYKFDRTPRQRKVARDILSELADITEIERHALVSDSQGMFETNMNSDDMRRVVDLLATQGNQIDEYCVPEETLYTIQENPWIMIIDMEAQQDKLREFIWG